MARAPATAPAEAARRAGGTTGGATGTLSAQARALIARANTEFDAAQKALKAGDFAEYGRQIDALKQTLGDLQSLQQ